MDKKNVLTLLCFVGESHKHLMIFFLVHHLVYTISQCLPLTRALKGFFLQFKPGMGFGGRQSTVTMVFTDWPREGCFPVSQALGGKCRCLKPFLQYFAKGSDTASCQDYKEYEVVDYLLEETQIDLFTH